MTPERRKIVDRVTARLKAIQKDWNWIGLRLGESPQTLNNWRNERGIPAAKHQAVAKLLGLTVEELLGHNRPTADHWPFPHIPASRFADLTEGQLLQAEGVLLDKLNELDKRGPPAEKQRPAAMEQQHNDPGPRRNRKTAP